MRNVYDFSKAINSRFTKTSRQITINLDNEVISYFKEEAGNSGIPYQKLINLYLLDCVRNNKKINIFWE